MHALVAAVADDLGTDVRATSRLGGGDVAESYRMELADGRTVFDKTHRDPPPVQLAVASGADGRRPQSGVAPLRHRCSLVSSC
jgi:hypothetical protein